MADRWTSRRCRNAGEETERSMEEMQEVRIRVEHVHVFRIGRERLCVPEVRKRYEKPVPQRRSRRRTRYWFQVMPVLVALAVMLGTYGCLAVIALSERGYFAMGGEVFLAAVAGFLTFEVILHIWEEN